MRLALLPYLPHQHSCISEIHKEERQDKMIVWYMVYVNKIAEESQRAERLERKAYAESGNEIFVALHSHSAYHKVVSNQSAECEKGQADPHKVFEALEKWQALYQEYAPGQYSGEAEKA
jgi:hypothetical protein